MGREKDLAVIQAFVDELPVRGSALLLSGEPGVGKSALLDAVEEQAAAANIRLLRAAGAEFEDVDFFGLNQLLLPLRGDVDRLDSHQQKALEVTLGFSRGPAYDRLVVSNAVQALLCRAAADRPLLLLVDNLQWLDEASALVLGFVARRLRGCQVGLIAAERTGASRRFAPDVPTHEVQPLDDDASAQLVTARFPGLARTVLQRIVTEARGNVLALLELPVSLSGQQRAALVPLPPVLPLSGRLRAQLRDQPGRRAWHLAGGAIDQNRHGASEADQARRLASAAYLAASVIGDLGAAEALLADAQRVCPGRVPSAEIALATAFVLLHEDGDVAAAHRLLLRGMQTADDTGAGPLNVEGTLQLLATVCRLSGRAEHWESLDRFIDPKAARSGLDREAESLACPAESAEIVRIGGASVVTDSLPECRQALRRVTRSQPDGSAGTPAMEASILLAMEAYQTGQWDEAWRLAESAAQLCASRGYQLLQHQAQTVLAFVAACRGDAETAQAIADDITRWAAPRRVTALLTGAHHARVLSALAQSDFQTAYHQAGLISSAGDIPAREPIAAWSVLDLVEAALRTDRYGDAVAHVEAVRQAGLAATSARMALLSTAAMAMTAPDEEAPDLFDLALAGEDAQRWPFERARVHLLYGERLRRVRAVTTARVHLGAALEEFRRLGAPTWADRAAVALRAAGQAPPGVDTCPHQVLTPQELEIARLAAAGLSNKQIGDRLFMSHRTVASHLYKMFPKLGITSRAALGRALRVAED